MSIGVSTAQASSSFRNPWPSCFFLWRSNSSSNHSVSISSSSKSQHRCEVSPLKSAYGTSPNMNMCHASMQCRQSSFFNTYQFVETRHYNNERASLYAESAWRRCSLQLQLEKGKRKSLETVDPIRYAKDFNECSLDGSQHSKLSPNLGSKHFNGNKASDCISPPASKSSIGLREQEPMTLKPIKNVATVDRMIDTDRITLHETNNVSNFECNEDIKFYSGKRTTKRLANNDPCEQHVPMQSNKKHISSQNGSATITHVPDAFPKSRNKNISLGKVNSVPLCRSEKLEQSGTLIMEETTYLNGSLSRNLEDHRKTNLKLAEAANEFKMGLAIEDSPKMTVNGSGTQMVEVQATGHKPDIRERLNGVYDSVFVVDSVSAAKEVVLMLTTQFRNLVHACDTEVAKIDVKKETPVDHGEIICFSIYSGPEADFGDGKSCIWVDVLDGGGKEILVQFAPFFEDPLIRKVWHNYSFDNHIVENYGIKVSGFHADTMHMARLWDSSRRANGGYSLEALSGDTKVMSGAKLGHEKELIGKVSMKTIFGRKKMKKDGSEGKLVVIPPVEELQREERKSWVCYSALDSLCTLKLYESLKNKLSDMPWERDGKTIPDKTMFNFYEEYWRPFGELLVKMETEGMLVDRAYLAEIEKLAIAEQQVAANGFRKWASKYCPDAKYMNVGSDAQVRQLLFGTGNCVEPDERTFKVPNNDKVIEEGKKTPNKYRDITLCKIGKELPTEMFTLTGRPSVSGDALKILAGKVSGEFDNLPDNEADNDYEIIPLEDSKESTIHDSVNMSDYGTALEAFDTKEEGREACHAIAALCEVCSIDSLISNFILPLQGSNISGKNGRVHCSLNINTETGRLSARRPNLQNQPALEKDRYKIRQAFIAAPGNSLIVADYGQLELRILAHLANCKSMLEAFKAGGDFHSRTAMNMYPHIREAVEEGSVLLEWDPQPGEDKPPVPLLKDAYASERRKAKMLNFSIAYGKTPVGLSKDWKVSVKEARQTVDLWYRERKEVRIWQELRKEEARVESCVRTLLGRARLFPSMRHATNGQKGHIERAAINTPVQGSAADVAMCAMLEISRNSRLRELGWRLLLQVHDEVILEGPTESAEVAKAIVVECMSKPFNGNNILKVDLAVDAKCAQNWYSAK